MIRFFPRVMTWWYQQNGTTNRMITPIAPDNGLLTSQSRVINAFNVDTVYASCPNVDVSQQPVILTIPKPTGTFSISTLDVWGQVFNPGIPTDRGGTYALTLASWHGTLPPGVTRVNVPVAISTWNVRADRYSRAANGVDYVNTVKAHQAFVASTRMATLSQYLADPSSGRPDPGPAGVAVRQHHGDCRHGANATPVVPPVGPTVAEVNDSRGRAHYAVVGLGSGALSRV